jgi:hypothetical protein
MGSPSSATRADAVRVAGGGRLAAAYSAVPRRGAGAVLFLRPHPSAANRRGLDEVLAAVGERPGGFVGVVSSFRTHLGDPATAAAEREALDRLRDAGARAVVFRPGIVLDRGTTAALRRFGPLYPLVPRRVRTCFVPADELFATIERERTAPARGRRRAVAVLGPNRPWRDVLAEHRPRGPLSAAVTAVCYLLSWLLVGQLAALLLAVAARWRPALRRWHCHTLEPRSLHELRSLCHPANARYVKVVGYNHGVNHFGHRHPGRVVVRTAGINRVRLRGSDRLRADAGATVRRALDALAPAGRTLYVVPNFSYVCLGTAYYVPIHGSAADFSCLAETITKVLLYDPAADRLVAATPDDPAFREHVYNPRSAAVLLRLEVSTRPQAPYYMTREELTEPDAATVLAALTDPKPTNVEVRKAKAAGPTCTLARFYADPAGADAPPLELPRDALGRLWDRLEENPVTAFLMHALTRHLAWHCELFLTADEFARFWADHRTLPVRKLQLRYIRRDGFPHSPFRDGDCVSADMFLFRPSRPAFEAYLATNHPAVRYNPGKHSR